MNKLKEINPKELIYNPFKLIGDDWALITSTIGENVSLDDHKTFNTMTASWGGVGVMWNKPVVSIYIRPQRYTYEFIEKNDFFTVSFYEEDVKDALKYCGKFSGRDVDKVSECGLVPEFFGNDKSVAFSKAKVVLCCKKLYFQDIEPANFLTSEIEKNYANKDYHRMYIAEIVSCYSK
ncbi:MAG: flavin reductase [Oscillospiraceae bacterium]